MLLDMDNKRAVDLANKLSIGGQIRHIDVKQYFLWELKEECLLQIEHVEKDDNDSDLFTKNLPWPTLKKHVQIYCRIDKDGKQGKVLKVTLD